MTKNLNQFTVPFIIIQLHRMDILKKKHSIAHSRQFMIPKTFIQARLTEYHPALMTVRPTVCKVFQVPAMAFKVLITDLPEPVLTIPNPHMEAHIHPMDNHSLLTVLQRIIHLRQSCNMCQKYKNRITNGSWQSSWKSLTWFSCRRFLSSWSFLRRSWSSLDSFACSCSFLFWRRNLKSTQMTAKKMKKEGSRNLMRMVNEACFFF